VVYEGGKEQYKILKDVLSLNNTKAPVSIINSIVEKEVNCWSKSNNIIKANQIKDCNVLEIDCEGAELEIIENIQIQPRVIIVELHPWLIEEMDGIERIKKVLTKKGYNISCLFDHQGKYLTQKEFNILLKESRTFYPRIVKGIGYKPPVMGVISNEKN
jgi:hypothetical protein